MWLAAVESGHDRPTTGFIRLMERLARTEVPDVIKVACYRHRYFGKPFHVLLQDVMRGRSFWTVAERELFAAYTSRCDECPFCITAHQGIAGAYTEQAVVDVALKSPEDAPLRPEMRAMLNFLRAMSDESATADDAARLRDAGIPDFAIDQAIRIATLFHVINRVMNAVGAGPLEGRRLELCVRTVKIGGYRIPPPVQLLSRGV